MPRFFNTAGPNQPDISYTLDPLSRIDMAQLLPLIDARRYFIMHAPRQTGKTSALIALMRHLNDGGRYRALYANIEAGQASRENVERTLPAIVQSLGDSAMVRLGETGAKTLAYDTARTTAPDQMLRAFLSAWCLQSNKPSVLVLDEIDALIGDTLLSVLRQLRAAYTDRPQAFPQTIILCGVRDVKDYRIHSARSNEIITGGSAFNIKAESIRLDDFSREQIATLYAQHTAETGQAFTDEALALVWDYTRGQPWLVNALAHIATGEYKRLDTSTVDGERMRNAKDSLIEKRQTHLDQLAARLDEPRVRSVIEPVLTGEAVETSLNPDDVQYTRDLGLIARSRPIEIANGIYREIIPRELTWAKQEGMPARRPHYLRPDGLIDTHALLADWQQFWRENSEIWAERFAYKEAGPQLLMQAFLQRVINGGGRIEREYGLGRRRTDLLVTYPLYPVRQRIVIELKVARRADVAQILADGLQQTQEYMDACHADEGHLIVFDMTGGKTWEERITCTQHGRVTVWGC